MDHLPQR
jgi:hypothetical protein